jgi:hypothetical protein
MKKVEQSGRLTNRRSFLLKGAAVGAGAIGLTWQATSERMQHERQCILGSRQRKEPTCMSHLLFGPS